MSNLKLLYKILRLKGMKITCFWFKNRNKELHLAMKVLLWYAPKEIYCPTHGRVQETIPWAPAYYDLDRSRVLWVGRGKGWKTIDRCFNECLSKGQKARILWASCDMSHAYTGAIEHHCPNATLVIDRFHVVKALNRSMDEVRKDQFEHIWHYRYRTSAEKFLKRWITAALRSRIPSMKQHEYRNSLVGKSGYSQKNLLIA